MLNEIKVGIERLEESRDGLNYALDMLEGGVGFTRCSNVAKEIELLAILNERIADYINGLIDQQEGLDISLESLLTVELGLNKKQEEEFDEIPF